MFIIFCIAYFPSWATHSNNKQGNGLFEGFVCVLLSNPSVPTSGIVQYKTRLVGLNRNL